MALIPVRNTFVHFGCGIHTESNCGLRSLSAPGRQTRSGYDRAGDAELSKLFEQSDDELSSTCWERSVSGASSETTTASSEITTSTESEVLSRKQMHKDFRPSKKHRAAYRRWKGQLETQLFEDESFDIDAVQVPDWVAPKDHIKVGLLQRTRVHLAFLKSTMR